MQVKGNVENVKAIKKAFAWPKSIMNLQENILELINEFSRIAACKINLPFVFLHTSNEQQGKEIKKKKVFVSKSIKRTRHLGINLPK